MSTNEKYKIVLKCAALAGVALMVAGCVVEPAPPPVAYAPPPPGAAVAAPAPGAYPPAYVAPGYYAYPEYPPYYGYGYGYGPSVGVVVGGGGYRHWR